HLVEQFAVAFEYGSLLGEKGQLEVDGLDLLEDVSADCFIALLERFGILFRDFAAQAKLPRIRNVLRDTKADVGKIAVGKSREGPRAAHVELLQHDLRVGQRGN